MRVVVIGATGHIGTYLIPRLVEVGMRGLTDGYFVRRPFKQSVVSVDVGDRVRNVVVPTGRSTHSGSRPPKAWILDLEGKEPRMLCGAHVDFGVLSQVVPNGCGSGFRRADDEEVGYLYRGFGRYTSRIFQLPTPRTVAWLHFSQRQCYLTRGPYAIGRAPYLHASPVLDRVTERSEARSTAQQRGSSVANGGGSRV